MEKCAQLNFDREETYKVMTWEEFKQNRRDIILSDPIKEITEDEWMEALECLPPYKWEQVDGVNRFMMSEFYTAGFTEMYARYNGKHYSKMVDSTDDSTWISKEMIDEHSRNCSLA